MICEKELETSVTIPIKNLKRKRWISKAEVVTTLLKDLLTLKSTAKHGYYLSVTSLKITGQAKSKDNPEELELPVTALCRTLLPKTGDIMTGVVHKVCNLGVLLNCGSPLNHIYLSAQKMQNYRFFRRGDTFINDDDHSRIQIGVVIRFLVFAVRWYAEHQAGKREFMVLASLEGDSLGPVSLAGSYYLDH